MVYNSNNVVLSLNGKEGSLHHRLENVFVVADKSEGRPPECHPLFRNAQGKAEDTSRALGCLGSVLQGSDVEQGTRGSPLISSFFIADPVRDWA